MPKQAKNKNSVEDIKTLVQKNRLAIGTATVVIAAAIIGISLAKLHSENQIKRTPIQTVNTSVEPASTTSSEMVSPTPAPSTYKKPIKLSFTSGDNFVTIVNGDSYGRIAKRYCGNSRLYLEISELNGNRDLHPGDTIKISCLST